MRRKPRDTKPRFKPGDRVCWNPKNKAEPGMRTGTVIATGQTKKEALAAIPKGFTPVHKGQPNHTGPTILVAADTPLLKPGYKIYSVPERHLQRETDSLHFKLNQAAKANKNALLELAKTVITHEHRKGKKTPEILRNAIKQLIKTQENP
jgi:hypothetical protein